jgi:hypothetical protein
VGLASGPRKVTSPPWPLPPLVQILLSILATPTVLTWYLEGRDRDGTAPPPWWKSALQERWFHITADGQIVSEAWTDAPSDHARWRLGNCFPTRADAAHAREHVREAFRRLR